MRWDTLMKETSRGPRRVLYLGHYEKSCLHREEHLTRLQACWHVEFGLHPTGLGDVCVCYMTHTLCSISVQQSLSARQVSS